MGKKTKNVNLRDDQIDQIKGIEETHPTLKGEGFSAVLRWLIDLALGVVRKEEEGEQRE